MIDSPCPKCGADTPDGLLCRQCSNRLQDNLASIALWWPALTGVLAKQAKRGHGTGRGSDEIPLPLDARAFKVRSYVRNQLTTWCHELNMGDLPPNHGRDMALWLHKRIERIRGHKTADQCADEFSYCRKLVMTTIDIERDLIYCGPCTVCDNDLYAKHNATNVTCRKCARAGTETPVVNVEERRNEMLAAVENKWETVAKCALVLAMFGLEIKADTIQNWARPYIRNGIKLTPRLRPKGANSAGHNLYRIGDVADLARAAIQKRAARTT